MQYANTAPLLEVDHLRMYYPIRSKYFASKRGEVKAVNDVSFSIRAGETLGIVGESGCGKTTVGRCVLKSVTPTGGSIKYQGVEIADMPPKAFRPYRREMQLIFQDPYSSLDPRQSVKHMLRETISAGGRNFAGTQTVEKLLELVGLNSEIAGRYPHEMSGGQRQRVGIARALACSPKLIVCDEPVSALDVSIQAQIINLFIRLQKELGLTYLFIAHDIAVVRHISTKIAVMYLGRIVEYTDSEELYTTPLHPYTKALLSAVPVADYEIERKRERIILRGEVPNPIDLPAGCPFHPRCAYAQERCRRETPELRNVSAAHSVACFFACGPEQ